MATGTRDSVLGQLRRVLLARDGGGLTDGELLERYVARREEAAFEALVRRHGPMVLGVCRRLLPNEQDAEDAFQAAFLVLARKAAGVTPRNLVGNRLYGVAYRTALKAKAAAVRRRGRERQVKAMPELPTEPKDGGDDWRPLLDHALQRLPDKYRVPVVLCELEGRTRQEAARQLAIPAGTLSSRLATARKRLARRLARHGLALPAGSLAVVLSPHTASAAVPAALLGPTVTAATRFAAGQATTGVISARVAALAEGMLKAMLLTKLKALWLLALAILASGAGILASQSPAAEWERPGKPRLEQRRDPSHALGFRQADPMNDGWLRLMDDDDDDDGDDDDDDDDG